MTSAWQRSAPRLRFEVPCDRGTHVVVWHRGALVLVDHADPLGESALAALGGDPPACVALAEQWRTGSYEERRPTRVAVHAGAAMVWKGAHRSPLPEPLRRLRNLTMLRRNDLHAWRNLLNHHATKAMQSRAHFGRDLRLVDGDGEGPFVEKPWRRSAQLSLPDRWLTHVWVRGLDVAPVPGGGFVVDAATSTGTDGLLAVVVLRPDLRGRPTLDDQRLDLRRTGATGREPSR